MKNTNTTRETRSKAMKTETQYPARKAGEERYVEFDAEFEMWAVFGLYSGHCYGQYSSEEQAEESLR